MSQTDIQLLASHVLQHENEAALYALLAVCFSSNPDAKLMRAVAHADLSGFDGLAQIEDAMRRMQAHARALPEELKAQEAFVLDLKRDWTKLFRGVSPDYGPTAPYALLFLRSAGPEALSDIAALFIDGGYDGYQQIHDRVDGIGVGFDYLKTVSLQLAAACTRSDAVEYKRLKLCRDEFLSQYFAPWVPEFVRRAEKFVQTEFYAGVLELAASVIAAFAPQGTALRSLLSEEESRRRAEADIKAAKPDTKLAA